MEEEQEIKISKYNSGIAQIYRLDNLWKDVNNHSRAGQFLKWNCDLDKVWCELARDLKEEDYDKKKKEFDDFDTNLCKLGNFEDNASTGFDKISKACASNRNEQYKVLMEKELFLRRLENFLGKGTAWDEGEDDEF